MKKLELTGQKFNRLTVVSFAGVNSLGKTTWNCVCECGAIVTPTGGALKFGNSTSCGKCIKREGRPKTYNTPAKKELQRRKQIAYKRAHYAEFNAEHRARRAELDAQKPIDQRATAKSRRWVSKNLDKARNWRRQYMAKRRKTPRGALNARMSNQVRQAVLGKKGQSWKSILGYGVEELKRRIESQFKKGMSWDRLIAGEIHIDHIIPKSKFKFSSPGDIEFKRCWALENLRPEWAEINVSRGCKIVEPSQIALGI